MDTSEPVKKTLLQRTHSSTAGSSTTTGNGSSYFTKSKDKSKSNAIATIQPGLEDHNTNSSNYQRNGLVINETEDTYVTTASATKRSLFRRSLTINPNNPVSAASSPVRPKTPEKSNNQNDFKTPENGRERSSSKSSRFSRKKSVVVNPKASQLRAEIACKEYEVQRFERLIRKKSNNQLLMNDNYYDTNSADINLLTYQKLLVELNQIKNNYVVITGIPYENTNQRKNGPFSRLRSFRSKDKPQIISGSSAVSNATTNVSAQLQSTKDEYLGIPMISSSNNNSAVSSYRLPSHWKESIR